jgi:hypothetical protein
MKEKAEAADLGFAWHGVIVTRLLFDVVGGGISGRIDAKDGN